MAENENMELAGQGAETEAGSDTLQENGAEDASGKKKKKKEPKARKVKEPKPKKAPPKKSVVGVEIGNSRVKIVETRKGRLVRFAAEDIPDDVVRDGGVLQWEAMGDLLKAALKKNKISGKKAALVVPDSIAFTRRTLMPPMSAVQLEYNLPYEFHDFITEDKDKYVYDYSMVDLIRDEEGNVTDMDLLAVAAPKEVLNHYIRMFKRAGLKLMTAAPESQALGNICRELKPEMAGIDYALLDLGSAATRIDIFSKGIYEVTRTIETGANAIVAVIADIYGCDPHIAEMYMRENKDNVLANDACRDIYSRIAIDVMRAINYYTFENRENTLETMYYYGGSSVNEPLIEEIRDTIQLEFLPLSALSEGDDMVKSAIMHGASALGICWE